MQQSQNVAEIRKWNTFQGNNAPVPLGADMDSVRIVSATRRARDIEIIWGDGHRSRFHYFWLRHSCYCAKCGDSADAIRAVTVRNVSIQVTPTAIQATPDGYLEVIWSDDEHVSRISGAWLRAYCYSDKERARRRGFKPKIWDARIEASFPMVRYPDVVAGESELLHMLELLRDYGIVRVNDVGDEPVQTEQLAKLLGPIHETTVYGKIFDVKVEVISKLGSKTAMHQDPHHDDAFYYSPPGIDIFHCVLNSPGQGGESTYVDGFAVAEAIRRESPQAFELLTTVPIVHNRRHAGEIDLRCYAPLIRLDWNGNLSGVRYFDRAMAPLDAPEALIEPLFHAIRLYSEKMTSSEFKVEFLVPSGTGMLIDNQRVMHGRNAFSISSGRHIRLCHVDRDEFHGRLRDLGARMGRSNYDLVWPAGACPA